MGSIAIPDVSVIIPLYNKGKYIARALDSVFAQNYQDFEVIVVDDGSTDDGPDIVRKYDDPRLRLIQQANAGPGAARNKGLKESTAPYVAFLDADDEWLPEYLETSLCLLEHHPDCDVCVSAWYQDTVLLWPDRCCVNIVECYEETKVTCDSGPCHVTDNMSDKQLKDLLSLFYTGTVLAKRNVVEAYGGFYAKGKSCYGEDHYLWLQLAMNHKVFKNLIPLAFYHNSASALASGGFRTRGLEAFMLDPEPIRRNCKHNKNALERWLALYALRNAHNRLSVGKVEDIQFLMRQFPLMRQLDWEYYKLRIKILCPFVARLAGCVRMRICQR